MWNHLQPHLYDNLTQLEGDMILNRNFAKEHGISVDFGYSIGENLGRNFLSLNIILIILTLIFNTI